MTVPVPEDVAQPFTATAAGNTAVVLTFAAAPNQAHRISDLVVSYSAAPTAGGITITDGGSTVFQADVTSAGVTSVPLPQSGMRGSVNSAVVVTLAAAGGAVVGKLNVGKVSA